MTAVNTLRQRNAAHIISDGAVYDLDGVVRVIRPKVFCLPHIGVAIATRGSARAADVIGTGLAGMYASFDDLCEGVEHGLERIIEAQAEHLGGGGRIELTLAGWSTSRKRPETYVIVTIGERAAEGQISLAPYKLTELPEISMSPVVESSVVVDAFAEGQPADATDDMKPELHGLAIIELQRQQKTSLAGGEPHHWVGGFSLLTSVYRDRIEQKLLKRWPDAVGSVITPEPIDWPAWWDKQMGLPAGLSPQQRDMLLKKRKAKKAA